MKARVITGVIGGFGAIALLLFAPVIVIRVIVAALCVIAMYELLNACGCKQIVLNVAAYLFAASVAFLDLFDHFSLLVPVVAAYIAVLGIIQVFAHSKVTIEQTALIFSGSLMIVLPIGCLAAIIALPEHGRAYIFLTLIIAWFSDMGAFFAGKFFGKHKLCEAISPKKTIEGFVGGVISSIVFSLIGAWIYQMVVLGEQGVQPVYWQVALIALIVTPVSVVGDLFCSIIKRRYGLKDFGKIFPGHGGVLDRFDSVIFVSPLLYLAFLWFPLIH